MPNTIILPALAAALMVLTMPSQVDAYGAAHVGYTHVGPNGVYHAGETAAAGPRGVAAAGHTTAVGAGGAEYHAGYGAAAGGYRYTPTYAGGSAVGGAHYAYVR
jgi:hypothetical protein